MIGYNIESNYQVTLIKHQIRCVISLIWYLNLASCVINFILFKINNIKKSRTHQLFATIFLSVLITSKFLAIFRKLEQLFQLKLNWDSCLAKMLILFLIMLTNILQSHPYLNLISISHTLYSYESKQMYKSVYI